MNASQQVSLLDEITVYTDSDENIPLKTIFDNISEKNAAGAIPSAKDNPVDIRAFFKDIAPGYDEERVYISDMKKILKWYDLISAAAPAEIETETERERVEEETPSES